METARPRSENKPTPNQIYVCITAFSALLILSRLTSVHPQLVGFSVRDTDTFFPYLFRFSLPTTQPIPCHKMGLCYDEIPDKLVQWIAKQKMFWVATAALNGHVNLSPKGHIECFHVLSKNCVWFEDMTGSGESFCPLHLLTYTLPPTVTDTNLPGIETIAHIREPGNARITILFHAFEGAPRILKIWGTGMYTSHRVHPLLSGVLMSNPSRSMRCRYCARVWHTRLRCAHTPYEPQGRLTRSDRYRRAQGRYGERPFLDPVHMPLTFAPNLPSPAALASLNINSSASAHNSNGGVIPWSWRRQKYLPQKRRQTVSRRGGLRKIPTVSMDSQVWRKRKIRPSLSRILTSVTSHGRLPRLTRLHTLSHHQ